MVTRYNEFINESLIYKIKSKIKPEYVKRAVDILDIKETDSKKEIAIKILKFMAKCEISNGKLAFIQIKYTGLSFLFVAIADIMGIPPYIHDPNGILNELLDKPGMMNIPGIITVASAFIYSSIKGYKKYIFPLFKKQN
jgi:hypothetical protein